MSLFALKRRARHDTIARGEINGYIDKYSGNGRFIDAFCGIGHVAIAAANKGWPIVINDQMLYAGYISRARLFTDAQVNFEALGGYDRAIAALNSVGGKVKLDGGGLW